MQGIKITFENGNIKFIACYHYERKGTRIITLGENNEVKIYENILEVKEL